MKLKSYKKKDVKKLLEELVPLLKEKANQEEMKLDKPSGGKKR